jgi:hypothetical protein
MVSTWVKRAEVADASLKAAQETNANTSMALAA